MIWNRPKKDPYRWHKRYAIFPRTIGERRIWLEPYAWRYLRPGEEYKVNWYPMRGVGKDHKQFTLRDGYTMNRTQYFTLPPGFPMWSNHWWRPKNHIRAVS